MTQPIISNSTGDNPYIFGDAALDRQRLETQTRVYSDYVRHNARRLVGARVESILDLGCGEGQLGFVLREVYPHARLIGIDRDQKAIAQAQAQARALGLADSEFVIGNIEEALPAGPFDLIYASVIFLHTRDPRALAARAYAALSPGGQLWVKDFDPEVFTDQELTGFLGGSYLKMIGLLTDGMAKIGGHPYFMAELPDWLAELGAENIRHEREYYTIGGTTELGVASLAISLGAFLTALPRMAKAHGKSEQELSELYAEVVNRALKTKEEGHAYIGNIIAAKPKAKGTEGVASAEE